MAKFEDLRFDIIKDDLKVYYQKIYYFFIPLADLKKISEFKVDNNSITFLHISKEKAEKKFQRLINIYLPNLSNIITGNPTTLVHNNSGIPLIGSLSFGIVDKGSNYIEIKPLTGCNLNCIFCSVDEGKSSKKTREFLVEKDYLISELRKLLEYKRTSCDIYINPHGEPLLYPKIVELIYSLKTISYVNRVTIITNGLLLSNQLATELINAGLNNLNISLNALDSMAGKQLSGTDNYNLEKMLKIIEKIKNRIKVIITPVLIQGINKREIEHLIEYCSNKKIEILIQNFQINKKGRNPVKELPMNKFSSLLKEYEKKYRIPLIKRGQVIKTKELKKPFLKGEIILPERIIKGRSDNEKIAILRNRNITVTTNSQKIRRIKITSDKHNIYYGISI